VPRYGVWGAVAAVNCGCACNVVGLALIIRGVLREQDRMASLSPLSAESV
jgi:hypothetical protein